MNTVDVEQLRPTQMSVGFQEVERKRRQWKRADAQERSRILRLHVIPAVTGPKGRFYLIDHHHFAKALVEEGEGALPVFVAAELHHLPKDEFWTFLDNRSWCHAYDAAGVRRPLGSIPRSLADLEDDPFRSLVAELIRVGAVAKSDTPFFEFLWADFLRRRMAADQVRRDVRDAVPDALKLVKGDMARELPGWCGARDG